MTRNPKGWRTEHPLIGPQRASTPSGGEDSVRPKSAPNALLGRPNRGQDGKQPLQWRFESSACMDFAVLQSVLPGAAARDISRELTLRSRACPTTGSDRGSLRDHDLTLAVRRHLAAAAWLRGFRPTLPFGEVQARGSFPVLTEARRLQAERWVPLFPRDDTRRS